MCCEPAQPQSGDQRDVPRADDLLAGRAVRAAQCLLPRGGPSAGLVFALAIYDQLTLGELVGNAHIAVTGTITTTGEVGSIGGIRQKMIGAKKAGATVFLLPIDNCAEAVQRIPAGLRAIPVKTLREAISVLEKLKSDASGDLPSCSAG